jgi:hypothetical protein
MGMDKLFRLGFKGEQTMRSRCLALAVILVAPLAATPLAAAPSPHPFSLDDLARE